jgi:hypothetical protein
VRKIEGDFHFNEARYTRIQNWHQSFDVYGLFKLNSILAVACPKCGAGATEPCDVEEAADHLRWPQHVAREIAWYELEEDPGQVHAERILEDFHEASRGRPAHLAAMYACPDCEAPKDEWCRDLGNTEHFQGRVHWGRWDAMLEDLGLTDEDLRRSPYNHWPDADRFEKWGIFIHSGYKNGRSYRGPVKLPASGKPARFSTYEQAAYWEKKLERNHKWRSKNGNSGCLGVFPMYRLSENEEWEHLEYT